MNMTWNLNALFNPKLCHVSIEHNGGIVVRSKSSLSHFV